MIKIHDKFYMTDDESIGFVYNEGLLYIENDRNNPPIVLNPNDIKDLIWFLKSVVIKKK